MTPHGKRGGFWRYAGKYGKYYEAGAEDAKADGRSAEELRGAGSDSHSRRWSGRGDRFRKHEVTKVKLAEEVVDPDDIEMLEDLIMAATNEAMRKIDEASQQSMSQITGALGGGLPF